MICNGSLTSETKHESVQMAVVETFDPVDRWRCPKCGTIVERELDNPDPSEDVIITDESDKYHRSHSSALLHLACQPTVKGRLARLNNVGDRDACDHPACFGGPNEVDDDGN